MVGQLLLDLPGRSARVARQDLGRLDGESGIFQRTHPIEADEASADQDDHKQPRNDFSDDGVFADINRNGFQKT